jgi:general secretion pathway protein G
MRRTTQIFVKVAVIQLVANAIVLAFSGGLPRVEPNWSMTLLTAIFVALNLPGILVMVLDRIAIGYAPLGPGATIWQWATLFLSSSMGWGFIAYELARWKYSQQPPRRLIVPLSVLAIIVVSVSAALSIPVSSGRHHGFNKTAALAQLQVFRQALDKFERDNGRYPTTAENLNALVTNPGGLPNWTPCFGADSSLASIPLDPWGNPYIYRCPGTGGKPYDLLSAGPDGKEGTADDISP